MLSALQINNAGDGGLYAEMVRDRSFEALAAQPLPVEAGIKVYQDLLGFPPRLWVQGYAKPDDLHQMDRYAASSAALYSISNDFWRAEWECWMGAMAGH